MSARSSIKWLLFPDVRPARAALAAGSLAGLAVLGACSEGTVTTRVAGPTVSEPSFATGVVGANSHTVQVCVDPASPAGTYTFAVSHNAGQSQFDLERTTSSDPVIGGGVTQNSLGPYVPGDIITAAPSIEWTAADILAGVPECVIVFQRDESAEHTNNRLWTFPSGLGTVNPFGTVDIDLGPIPAGYTYNIVCVNDDPNMAQSAGCTSPGGISQDVVFTSANVFHGSVVTYTFVAGSTVTGGSATVGDVKFQKTGPTTFGGKFRVANTAGGQAIQVNSVTVTLFRTSGGTSTAVPLSGCVISPSSFIIPQSGSQTVDVSCTRQSGTFTGGQDYKVFISVDVNGGQNSPYTNTGNFKG